MFCFVLESNRNSGSSSSSAVLVEKSECKEDDDDDDVDIDLDEDINEEELQKIMEKISSKSGDLDVSCLFDFRCISIALMESTSFLCYEFLEFHDFFFELQDDNDWEDWEWIGHKNHNELTHSINYS